MKLSDEIVEALMHQSGFSAESVLDRIERLEADSQMLEDLIEIANKQDVSLRLINHVFYMESFKKDACEHCGRLDIDIGREIPREAIAAAIKKWKENK